MIEIMRVQQAIKKNPHFLERIYTAKEIAYCKRKADPWQSFAARFAAKEAVGKAFGTGIGILGLKNIEIINETGGQPKAVLHGAAEEQALLRNIRQVHISLSHSKEYAIATAVLEGE